MCLSPITLRSPKGTLDGSGFTTRVVPCGKCILCLKRRSNSWSFRLQEEVKVSTSAAFITFTYDNDHLPYSFNGNPTLRMKDFQLFMKRLRKKLNKHSKIKYYAVGEYGTNSQRPHYHAIMFNLPQNWLKTADNIFATWKHGHVDIRQANPATIKYVTKYINKGRWMPLDELDDREPEKSLMSKKMGINHLTDDMVTYYKSKMINYVILPGGIKTSMPRYFKDKIYTDDEKRQLHAAAIVAQEKRHQELFNNDLKLLHQWKQEHIRKQERAARESRNKL